jgi:hypothetical protein
LVGYVLSVLAASFVTLGLELFGKTIK